jgi:CzcA family heavy metal efflux pump
MKDFFLKHRSSISVSLFLILAGGVFFYTRMQTSLFPEVTFPKVKIIADAGLQPVDKMMITVTKPLENAIKQVPNLALIRSTTSRGSCEISAFLNWGTNIDLSQQQIESKINDIKNNLPPNTEFDVEKMNPSILPVMGYTLDATDKDPIELNFIANNIVKPFISQVEGVSTVLNIGGRTKEYWVMPDRVKMSSLGITPDLISTVFSQTNFITSNGYLSDYRRLYLSVTDETLKTTKDIEELVIKNDGKRVVLLRDIATVSIHEKTEYIRINANGKSALLIAVVKQPNANVVELTEKVKEKVAELAKILPKGVTMKPYYIQADFVSESIQSVEDSIMVGLALALIVAILFLRSFRATATILLTIPVTLGLTCIVLYAIGYSFNIMTLGAIAAAIGLIIDDAIVVTEQLHRVQEEHPQTPPRFLVGQAVHHLLPAMIGSSVSTIVIFVPFVLMTGVAGAYFSILANTMITTLICSFFVTWIGLPAVYILFSPKTVHGKTPPADAPDVLVKSPAHKTWISFFIHRPLFSLLLCGALMLATYLILPRLETGFLPEMDEGSIVLDYNSPPGTSLEETDRILHAVETQIVAVPEVEAYSRRTGTQMGFFITEPNRGDYLIHLKKKRERSTEEVIADLRKQVQSTQPALKIDFGQVIGDMLGDLMESVQPIEVKVFGNNPAQLQDLARQVAKVVSDVPGTADVFNGITVAGPAVSIEPNDRLLAQFGITPAGFQYQMQTYLQGNVIGNIPENEQQTAIRLIFPNAVDESVDNLKKQQVVTPAGKWIPLSSVADVRLTEGAVEINRENLQSMIAVTARLEGRDLGSVMRDLQSAVSKTVPLPQGFHITYGGAYAEQKKSFQELLLILIASSLLVFTVILFLFRNFRAAALILVVALLGISGSYLALFLTHTALNVGSYTGLIMIVGIIGENAIFTFRQFHEALKDKTIDEALIYAISTRLRPKLMTALGAIIALAPLALGIGAGAQLHQPLAIAVIGGLVIALPLLLIVLPTGLKLLFRNYKHETTSDLHQPLS